MEICLISQTPQNVKKLNVHKIKGAHLKCVNTHYAKFEYKGMKTVGMTYNTNQTLNKIRDFIGFQNLQEVN